MEKTTFAQKEILKRAEEKREWHMSDKFQFCHSDHSDYEDHYIDYADGGYMEYGS